LLILYIDRQNYVVTRVALFKTSFDIDQEADTD